jgi:hypothetical protein
MDQINWLALVTSVSGQNGTLRVRPWRQMKAIGCCATRWRLPVASPTELRQALANLRDELLAADGMAHVLQVVEDDLQPRRNGWQLFDRSEPTSNGATHWHCSWPICQMRKAKPGAVCASCARSWRRLPPSTFLPVSRLESARRQCNAKRAPATTRQMSRWRLAEIFLVSPADYQQRLWATRARPWVDRIASAWLIRRFIDPTARFAWLTDIHACPVEALGFDDGATFSHIGERVTFEVLLASFGFEHDPALARLGELVHALDVGGSVVPEVSALKPYWAVHAAGSQTMTYCWPTSATSWIRSIPTSRARPDRKPPDNPSVAGDHLEQYQQYRSHQYAPGLHLVAAGAVLPAPWHLRFRWPGGPGRLHAPRSG